MAFVQAINAAAQAVTSITTAAISISSNNLLVSAGQTNLNPTTVTFSDSASNTYTNHSTYPQTNSATGKAWMSYSKNIVGGGSVTFTMDLGGVNASPSMVVYELSGRDTSSPVDAQAASSETTATTSHSGASSSVVSGADVVAFEGDNGLSGTQTYTAGTGWTIPTNGTNTDGARYKCSMMEYQTNVSSGTYTLTSTTGTACKTDTLLMSFKSSTADTLMPQIFL